MKGGWRNGVAIETIWGYNENRKRQTSMKGPGSYQIGGVSDHDGSEKLQDPETNSSFMEQG